MKKLTLAIVTMVLIAAPHVMAEGPVSSPDMTTKRRPDKTESVQIQEIRGERKEIREETKTKLQTMRSNIAENHANRLEKRFKFYSERLNNIISRFQTRLDLLKKDGKDPSSAQAKLDAAKAKLAEAKVKGEAAVAAFKAIDPAKFSEQKTEALAARDLATAARKLFIDTETLLKEALKSLKTISKPGLPAASAAVENAK